MTTRSPQGDAQDIMLFDLIIIGGGPAGITAGIYAARKNLKTLLIAKDFFGLAGTATRVENWPGDFGVSGMALMQKLEKHLRALPIEIKCTRSDLVQACTRSDLVQAFCVGVSGGDEFTARAVIVATGAAPRALNVPGEKELAGRGVSYCATCDGPFFKDKAVFVVGGGNSGFSTALEMAKFAKKVYLVDKQEKLAADPVLQIQARENKKIEILVNTILLGIEGEKKVQAIIYKNLKTGKTFQQPMDGVFAQIGAAPNTDFLGGLLALNEKNEIKIDPSTGAASLPGVFAAGDCTDAPYKQMIVAAGAGAVAALSAYKYLGKDPSAIASG